MNSRARFTFSAFCMRIRGFLLYRPSDTSPSISPLSYLDSMSNYCCSPMISCGCKGHELDIKRQSVRACSTHHKLDELHTIGQVSHKRGHWRVSICLQFCIEPSWYQCSVPTERDWVSFRGVHTPFAERLLLDISRACLERVKALMMERHDEFLFR